VKKKIILVPILILAMILWPVLFNIHLQAFNEYQQWFIKRIGSTPDFDTFWNWGNGPLLIAGAIGILMGWFYLVVQYRNDRKAYMHTVDKIFYQRESEISCMRFSLNL
jgi:hypothetical protein